MNNKDTSETIDIRATLKFLLKRRKFIYISTLLFAIVSTITVLIIEKTYLVECVIKPAEPTSENSISIIKTFSSFSLTGKTDSPITGDIIFEFNSKVFRLYFFEKYKNNIKLFPKYEKNESDEFKNHYALERLDEILNVEYDITSQVIIISVELNDKHLAKIILLEMLEKLKNNIGIRNKSILNDEIVFYERNIKEIKNPFILEKMKLLISKKIEKQNLLNHNIFTIIDPPVLPYKKHFPKRIVIIVASTLLGFILPILFLLLLKLFKGLQKSFK